MRNYILPLILSIFMLLAGCGTAMTIKESPATQLVVKYAVMKVIEDSTNPFGRAARIVELSDKVLTYVKNDEETTIPEIDDVIRQNIDWDTLEPSDRLLVDTLLDTIETDLESKIEQRIVSTEEVVKVVRLIETIRSTASTMSTEAK